MNIVEALKSGKIDRISVNDRWMHWSGDSPFSGLPNKWHVRKAKFGNESSVIIIQTTSEDKAVEALLKE